MLNFCEYRHNKHKHYSRRCQPWPRISQLARPGVISTDPANTAGSVATNQKITAIFGEPMDSSTITGTTFTVTGPGLKRPSPAR
jgi:Bacterial Ig-like domain